MSSDFQYIVLWWLIIFAFSLATLPLTQLIFSRFWDKGYAFSKIIAIALTTYIVFVLGVFKISQFSIYSIVLIIAVIAFVNYRYFYYHDTKKYLGPMILEESMFFILLVLWSFVRGFSPNIEGLEKYMDWGFINSMLRTKYMPPLDMWYASEPINYYYFGHLMFAMLTKISSIPSAVTYNLAIATVCSLTFTSAFSLASNLVATIVSGGNRKLIIIAGALSAALLTFGGNLHPIYKIININIQNNGALTLTKDAILQAVGSYWYPDATRFIGFDPDINDKTIHEFPLYSFVVADLHGHMNDIPVILFLVAFLFSALSIQSIQSKKIINWTMVVPLGLTLSIAYMTNAWDFAVYGLLFAISYFINLLVTDHHHPVAVIKKTFVNGILVIIFWYIFTLPFSINFTPMAEGLKLSDSRSPFYQLFILYGGFWLICLPFIFFFKKLITDHRSPVTDYFVLSLIITATILIIIPEIGYLKDIYIYDHRRANTMFKLVYQAFIMYSLVSGYIFIRLVNSRISRTIILLVTICHLIYPYFAIRSYYGNLKDYQGLWGLNYLKDSYPDNLAAIEWIEDNITGQPVMLEASGDSYTTFNHVSSITGLPTVEGWVVHEWLWRGGYDKPGARASDVQVIYESSDLDQIRQLISRYNVEYIFVGAKEHEKYKDIKEDNFVKLGARVVFESGATKVYQL